MNKDELNALECVQKLEEVGVPREQAEAHILILLKTLGSNVATKYDIKELEVKIKELDVKMETKFKELDVKMETKFKELEGKTETKFKELEGKIKEVEDRIGLKMVITGGSFAFMILASLVTLVKLGLLASN